MVQVGSCYLLVKGLVCDLNLANQHISSPCVQWLIQGHNSSQSTILAQVWLKSREREALFLLDLRMMEYKSEVLGASLSRVWQGIKPTWRKVVLREGEGRDTWISVLGFWIQFCLKLFLSLSFMWSTTFPFLLRPFGLSFCLFPQEDYNRVVLTSC